MPFGSADVEEAYREEIRELKAEIERLRGIIAMLESRYFAIQETKK
jgi:predicted RNase H-like nuclease (RuvC/YqgF family)